MLVANACFPEAKALPGRSTRTSLRRSRAVLSAILGNRWSLLVLDEACRGTTRFNQFQERLGVAPKSLSRSLHALVNLGMLSRRAYSNTPPRWEYLLTEEGEKIRPAIASLSAWGDQHLPSEQLPRSTADMTGAANSAPHPGPSRLDAATVLMAGMP